jgi:1,4-dihydroxy-2-naphthoyl-CoA hydrolase
MDGTARASMAVRPGTLPHTMGIKIVSASRERVEATMPVEGNTQPYGVLHGGASCVLAETLGSIGAALHASSLGGDLIVLGIEINATHHRAASSGLVTGVASLVHAGRTLATYDIVISDSAGQRVCTSRLTCLIRKAVPGTTLHQDGAGR